MDGPGGRPALRASALTKTYGLRRGSAPAAARPAVDGLDLTVPAGTVLGLLGPNGAGKTTAIRILTTVLQADSGSFEVAGVPGDRPDRLRPLIGVLPESAGLPAAQTGREWLTFHARLYGLGRAAAASTVTRLLDEVGLADRGDSLLGGYSRGMRQRAGIARALLNDPTVVFLDEPTLGLDPLGRHQVLELVAGTARDRGVTVVLSTHAMADVEQVCDRVVIMNLGRVVADGTVAEVARLACAPRHARLTVPQDRADDVAPLLGPAGVGVAPLEGGRAGRFELLLPADADPAPAAADALGRLLAGGVPVLEWSVDEGRLSEAFLAVTAAPSAVPPGGVG